MKVLLGKEVNRLSVDRNVQMTKASAKAESRPYYRARYDGIGFTVDQAFIDALNAGVIAEITLTEGIRKVADPLNVDKFIELPALALNSFATKDQVINMTKFERELEVIENPALGNIEVSDELLAKLQLALKPSEA